MGNQFPSMLDQMVILMKSPDVVRRNIKLLWVKPGFVTQNLYFIAWIYTKSDESIHWCYNFQTCIVLHPDTWILKEQAIICYCFLVRKTR